MIRKLRIKFVLTAMLATIIVTFSIFGVIIFANYNSMTGRAKAILDFIADNNGTIPEYNPKQGFEGIITKETKFSTRYFYGKVDTSSEITEINIQNIAAVSKGEANELVYKVMKLGKDFGYYGDYIYKIKTESDGTKLVIVVDYSNQINNLMESIQIASGIIFGGLTLVFIMLTAISKKILTPMIKNIEKQKQFISNAGHELKTPIAVIMANTDVMEMTEQSQENLELIKSTKKQAERLSELTATLLSLARAEEGRIDNEFTTFSITDMIEDEISEFKALAKNKEMKFLKDGDITIRADQTNIKELIIIFLDNAIKYSDENGKIIIKAEKHGKGVKLQFMNTCENPKAININKIFDRFYRDDKSRNKKKEGYGIGLSMAKSILEMHKGKISAELTKDNMICFNVVL